MLLALLVMLRPKHLHGRCSHPELFLQQLWMRGPRVARDRRLRERPSWRRRGRSRAQRQLWRPCTPRIRVAVLTVRSRESCGGRQQYLLLLTTVLILYKRRVAPRPPHRVHMIVPLLSPRRT